MTTIQLAVGLKIPDNTALSALRALHEMGLSAIAKLKREQFYEFEASGDEKAVKERLAKTDVLVNANKNTVRFDKKKEDKEVQVLVRDKEHPMGLLKTLRERLGLTEVEDVRHGVLWTLTVEGGNPSETAKLAAEQLLSNRHYQEYSIQ